MENEMLYMLGIVAVGFALNFGLRAVPFLLFGSSRRELPKGVARFGAFVSPVIIAGLIVYSYAGLAWRTPWPYLAGALTVALQLGFRNPLASIVAGTVLYMALLTGGCASAPAVKLDAKDPSVRYTDRGVFVDGQLVNPLDVVEILRDNDIPTDRVVHIRMEEGTRDLRGARFLMGLLAKGGYTRPVLVTERKSEAFTTGRPKKSATGGRPAGTPPARQIRYKRAGER